jgi:hypothetical protein
LIYSKVGMRSIAHRLGINFERGPCQILSTWLGQPRGWVSAPSLLNEKRLWTYVPDPIRDETVTPRSPLEARSLASRVTVAAG